jgi:hypothetical protein
VEYFRTGSAITGFPPSLATSSWAISQNGEQKIIRSGGSRQNSGDKVKTLIRALDPPLNSATIADQALNIQPQPELKQNVQLQLFRLQFLVQLVLKRVLTC